SPCQQGQRHHGLQRDAVTVTTNANERGCDPDQDARKRPWLRMLGPTQLNAATRPPARSRFPQALLKQRRPKLSSPAATPWKTTYNWPVDQALANATNCSPAGSEKHEQQQRCKKVTAFCPSICDSLGMNILPGQGVPSRS